jgi:hypothetical protein
MAEYASNGKGNLGVTLGAIGTGLGALNGGMGGGILGNLLGGGNCENTPVNRYEFGLQKQLIEKDNENTLLKSNIYQDQKSLELYRYIDGKLAEINAALVSLGMVEQRVNSKLQLEAERRCCADNAIVNYANATFYPKSVADVTVGTTTTAQTLYNPIPKCDCGC